MDKTSSTPKRGFTYGTTIAVLLVALIVGGGFFSIMTAELIRTQGNERRYLVEATNAFTSTYTEERNSHNVVPAVFRRLAIERLATIDYKNGSQKKIPISMRMPGIPGLEIRTIETDKRLQRIIADIASGPSRSVLKEHRIEDGKFVGRTIFPSVASNQNCVSCHNKRLGRPVYKLGDIMGAYVLESDLTEITYKNFFYALIAGATALAGGIFLVRREHRRVRSVIKSLERQVSAERDKREAEAYANFLSSHDVLTGLSNRKMFRDRLNAEVEAYRTDNLAGVFVALVDLDDFKQVNDSMGHDAGDALLVEVGRRLNSLTDSKIGLAARFGGDEFAFIVQEGDRFGSSDQLGEQISQVMQGHLTHRGLSIPIRCSVGVASLADAPERNSTLLLKSADTALYSAKKLGKGRFRSFDTELRDCMGRRAELTAALPKAIEANQINAAFQPQIDLKSGRIRGFEALARWTRNGEAVSPDRFIRIAEETGLVRDLDLMVLRKAANFAVKLERDSSHPIHISTNMSALNFRSPGLADDILAILSEAELPAERLTIEITETVLMENWGEVRELVSILRSHGVRAALDDFGTGYSSLSYLSQIRFEEIKIDRSFVTNLCANSQTGALFEGIVDLSIGLGQTVVIEGIEREEQANFVITKGAHVGQGFLFSKPLNKEEATRFFIDKLKRDEKDALVA